MSSVYVLEPPTRGKVILHTSCGPLDVELWSKEAPKACRNFVQLCMEKYYDKTIFHRIISDFMVQAGDHTGTGTGGDSIYGEPFPDEFHTRLRFRQRGFLACANAGDKDSNNSQFFITLDRCEWLNNKHTLFGKVTGDTIYNLLKIAETETGKNDRPLEPPSIISTEILWNPFDDIVPRAVKRTAPQLQESKKQVKPKKKLNLLSFGEEALQEEEEISAVKSKIKSSHDVLNDPLLLKGDVQIDEMAKPSNRGEDDKEDAEEQEKLRKERQMAVRQALAGKNVPEEPAIDEDEMSLDDKMRQQILEKRKLLGKPPKDKSASKKRPSPKSEDDDEEELEDETVSRVKKEKLKIKQGLGSEARAELAIQKDSDLQMLSPLEQQRQKYKLRKRSLQGREETTRAMLKKFTEKLEQDTELASHKLEFQDNARDTNADHYVVIDPLIEKGKEKFNKLQTKMKRREREWAGRSLT